MILLITYKTRIAAAIIKDGKILLVKGKGYDELWTPGGKIEDGESDIECLRRELKEEINADLVSCKLFKEYTYKAFYHDYIMIDRVHIVEITGNLKPQMEIEKIIWVSKNEIKNSKYPMIPNNKEKLFPDLIKNKKWL